MTEPLPRYTAIPARRSPADLLRVRVYAVFGAVALMCLLSVFSFLIAVGHSKPALNPDQLQPHGRGLAEIAAADYLAARTTTVPVAQGVDPALSAGAPDSANPAKPLAYSTLAWDGFTSGTVHANGVGFAYEVHRFLVAATNPAGMYELDVTLRQGDSVGWVLAADPALFPAQGGSATKPLDWTFYTTLHQVPQPVVDQIYRWADAYAKNSKDALYTVTGDTQPDTYAGLGGFTAGVVHVTAAVPVNHSQQLLVRARVQFAGANGFQPDMEFDLLVGDLSSERPSIQAWGPAGSGLSLTPKQNAIRR